MATVTPRILQGFRDYLPETMIPKERMLRTIASVFESFGYPPLQTPALEYAEILLGKYGEEGDKLLYRFRDHGDRDVALRYDLTVPLARLVAQYPQIVLPFKRYQIAPVWRGERPGRGRFREFSQCDADVAGSDSPIADAEILAVGCAVLEALGVKAYRMKVSNRKVLAGFARSLGLEGRAVLAFFRTVDKLDKVGVDGVADLLAGEIGLSSGQIDRCRELLQFSQRMESRPEILEAIGELPGAAEGVEELRRVLALLSGTGFEERVVLDPSLARGMDYYTGTIYEGVLTDLPGFGSVIAGGRYDELIGVFAARPIPAVGISVGVDRLFAGLQELRLVKEEASPARVFVAVFSADLAATSMRIASELRRSGLAVEVSLGAEKIGKQFKYADRKRVPIVVVPGPDELARGEVTVKSLATGEQAAVPIAELETHLRALLSAGQPPPAA